MDPLLRHQFFGPMSVSAIPEQVMDTDNREMGRGYWGPDVDGDWIVTAFGTDLAFAVADEDKARRIAFQLSGVVGELRLTQKALDEAADAIDVADNIIAINCGTDTPKEWDRAIRKVSKARAALNNTGGQSDG